MAAQKRLVIVGGGFAGVTIARALDPDFDVCLVERRDQFYHNVGAMRAYAGGLPFERLLIPYSKLLRRGRVVQDDAVTISEGGVRGALKIYEADVIVVASGSRHRLPFKTEFVDSLSFLAATSTLCEQLRDAAAVTVQGDGPVAVELAGEIRAWHPEKRVTLSARAARLLPAANNPRLGNVVLRQLEAQGVVVQFGQKVDANTLLIPAWGAEYGVPCLGVKERAGVDGYFRVPGLTGVYAVGDAADCGEPPLTFLARRQAIHLATQLNGNRTAYRPSRRVAMSIPLGPNLGATQLPLPGLPVAGSWITRLLKGRDLFVTKNWERMGNPRMPLR